MKVASVEVTTVNNSNSLSLNDPRIFLDGNSTVIKPESVAPNAEGVSKYSTNPGEIQCCGLLSYEVGSCFFGVMFENPVVEGELCKAIGLYVTADSAERDDMYGLIKNQQQSAVLQRLAVFGSNQSQSISVTLAGIQVTASMAGGTDCSVKVIVRDLSP